MGKSTINSGLTIMFCAGAAAGAILRHRQTFGTAATLPCRAGASRMLLLLPSDIFRITGVVVLPGIEAPSAARSPLIMRPYDQELLTCQRYWQT